MRHTLCYVVAAAMLVGLALQSGCSQGTPSDPKKAAAKDAGKSQPDKPVDKSADATADSKAAANEPKGTLVHGEGARRPAAAAGAGRQSDDGREDRIGQDALLRQAAEQGRHGLLRHLPRSEDGLGRDTSRPARASAGQKGGRNSPTVINAAYATAQFWDGRAATLEEQALGPIDNPIEMGHTLEAMIADLAKIPDYKERFQKVFGTGVTKEGVAKAIAAFERTVAQRQLALRPLQGRRQDGPERGPAARPGAVRDANCADCHTPPLFSNYRFYNAGVGMDKEKPDDGRKDVTKKEGDRGKFRVPRLREVANTAPYFHDGSAATLEDAVALMAAGGKDNPNLSPMLKAVREPKLSADDQKDLVEFLKALSGEYPIVEQPRDELRRREAAARTTCQ